MHVPVEVRRQHITILRQINWEKLLDEAVLIVDEKYYVCADS